jgi:hypothetical protein
MENNAAVDELVVPAVVEDGDKHRGRGQRIGSEQQALDVSFAASLDSGAPASLALAQS